MINHSKASNPQDIPRLFIYHWNRRDAAGIASLFTEDAEFINVVGLWWHTKEAIEKAHAYGLAVIFPNSDLKLIRTKSKQLKEDIVIVYAKMELTRQSANEGIRNPGTRRTIFTFVTRQFDGSWTCVSAHNTDIVPGSETNVVSDTGEIRATSYRKN